MSNPITSPPRHPLLSAAKVLVSDMLSTLLFVGLYAITHSVPIAIGVAMALGVGRMAYQALRGIRIDTMQWLSLFLVAAFGGAAMITRNPMLVMLKPTLVYIAVGAVMLKSGWMNRYVPPIVQEHGADVTLLFGYVWAALMFATAAANLAVAWRASPAAWGWFIAVFPIGSKVALFLLQYQVTRGIVRRRIGVARALAVPAV
jgi:intracellular septation protein